MTMESQSLSDHSAGGPTVNVPTQDSISTLLLQMLAFKAETGNALTIFRAGFAFTMTTLPKTSLFPAFVAGFVRIFNRAKPGTVKTPVFFTSAVATLASVSSNLEATDFFTSHPLANASAIPPLDMARTTAFAFIGAISREGCERYRKKR